MIGNHADNGRPGRITEADFDSFAEWVFVGEKAVRKRLINDDHRWRALPDFLLGESTPFPKCDAHGAEVIGRHAASAQDRLFAFGNGRTTFDDDRISSASTRHQ